MAPLTTTSYAILGLLAIRPWTTYELAQQMERSLNRFWPRAQSRIYEEPKRLAALGLAEATKDHVGRRARTTYSITDAGQVALKEWVGSEAKGPVLEFEGLLHLFYAENAGKAAARQRIAEIRAWAEARNEENVAFARMYRDTSGPFPERLASIVLAGKFFTDFTDMVLAWTEWADAEVASWPSRGRREPARDALTEIAARPVADRPLPGLG